MVKPWQVVLATIGIFLAGLVTGGAITFSAVRAFHNKQVQQAQAQGGGTAAGGNSGKLMGSEQLGPQLIRRIAMADQLNLTAAQRFRINQIARSTADKLLRNRREATLSALLVIEQMQDEISGELTPVQRAKFEALLSDQRARMTQFKQNQMNDLHSGAASPSGSAP